MHQHQHRTSTSTLLPIPTNYMLTSRQLMSLVPAETRQKHLAGKAGDEALVFDLPTMGYAKLLGKGTLPKVPFVVRARYVSKEAQRKVKEAGGVIELVA
jgi:large subunit ribosomal protein L27Ae